MLNKSNNKNLQIFDVQPYRADNLVGLTTWGVNPSTSDPPDPSVKAFPERSDYLPSRVTRPLAWEWVIAGPAVQYEVSRIHEPRRKEIQKHPPHMVLGRECSMPGRSLDPHMCPSASPSQCVRYAGGKSKQPSDAGVYSPAEASICSAVSCSALHDL